MAGKLESLIKLRTEEMEQLKPRVTVSEAYECIKDAASYYGDPDFSEILTTLNPKSTHADSDGKYTFEGVAGGRYFIYAELDSSSFLVQWLVPVEVTKPGDVKCDLFNDTASHIYNKN